MKSKLLSLLFFMVAFYGFAEPIIATTTNTFGTVETSKPTTSVSGLPYVITNSGGNYAESIGSSELSSTILTDICGNFFSDNGGPSGNYSVPSSDNITLTPSIPGGAVTVNFTIFSTVQFSDILRIYDGPDTNAPLLGGFSGTTNPGSFTSTHSSGALTFLFLAFSTTGAPGWIANVTCTPPPCVPPTNLMVTDIEFASATLQWFDSNTPNIGYEWVVMADNVAPNTALAVATGTIIGKEVPVSGLLTGTTYDFYVRTDCDFSIISSWSVVESFTTTDCVTPGNVAAINLTTTSADLTWDASPSEINGYEWVVMADGVSPNTATAQTTGAVGTGVLTTAFSGLTSYTKYDAYVRTNCGVNINGPWSVVVSFTTLSDYCGGDHFYDTGGPNDNYLPGYDYTTTIEPSTPGDAVRVTFLSFETLAYWHKLTVYDGPDTSAFFLGDFSGTTNPGSFTSTHTSGSLTFRFSPGIYINDVRPGWDAVVSCARIAPLNLASDNILKTSADLSWDGEAVANNGYEWVVMNSGDVPDITNAVVTETVGSGVLTTAISGLTPDTNYDAYVRSEYGIDGKSFWSAIESFTTFIDFCGNNFYDLGGSSGNYPTYQTQNTLILPDNPGDVVTVTFLSLDIPIGYSSLYIYDGPESNNETRIGTLNNYTSNSTFPLSFTSTHPSGALYFKFYSGGNGLGWEAEVTCGPPPSISINSSSITSFTTCAGIASAEQTFTASGSQLQTNLVVTPPLGFEVSTTSGTGFGTTVSLTPASGIVSTTTIYIRLTNTSTGTPNGNVVSTSTHASTQNIGVSGTVNTVPTVTFTAPADLCVDAGVQTGLSGATPTGGVYSGSGVTDNGDGSTYSFSPVTAGTGVHAITYNFTSGNGCLATASDDLEVYQGQEIVFTAPADLCVDAGVQNGLGGATPAGGIYSGPGVTDVGDGATYSFNPDTAGIGVNMITYTTDGSGDIGSIDQDQPDGSFELTSWVTFFDYAQSFVSNESFICGAGIFLSNGGMTIELWDLLPNAVGATMLATGTADSVTNGYADVQWPSVSITPGNLYYLVFKPTVFGTSVIGTFDSSINGWAFAGEHFLPWTGFDFKFRTYSCLRTCSIDATDTIEVFDVPTVTFTALSDVSLNAGIQTGLGGASPSGGVYDGLGVTDDGNGMTYSFDPATAGVGTHTLTYNFTNGNSCSNSVSNDVEVFLLITVSPKVYLQGAFTNPNTGEETLMRDDLRVGEYIPTTSPYSDILTCDTTVFYDGGTTGAGTIEDDIVDWIWVELRDATDNSIVIESQSALLQRDGDVVGVDGTSPLSFSQSAESYFVVVKHRNHLGIMSSSIIALSTTTTIVDFTDAMNQITYGTDAQTSLGMPTGIVGMWAGDVNGDGIAQYTGASPDTPSILSNVLNDVANFLNLPTYAATGYNVNDVNMDGNTQYTGTNPDTPFILQNGLSHPGNFLNLSTFSIIEQLPE